MAYTKQNFASGSLLYASQLNAMDTAIAELHDAKESGELDGYTPVRGTDYWTAADIAEIKGYVDSAILNGSW